MSTAKRQVWEIAIHHQELNKSRLVRGSHPFLVEQKAALQHDIWNTAWKQRQSAERRRQEQELSVRSKAESMALAARKHADAERSLHKLANLLPSSLDTACKRDPTTLWQRLFDQREFNLPRPAEPKPHPLPIAPQSDDIRYQPSLSFLDRTIRKLREQKELEAHQLYQQDHDIWMQNKQHIEQQNQLLAASYAERVTAWEERRQAFANQVAANNQIIAEQYNRYLAHEPDAICDHCDLVLTLLPQPYEAPGDWTLHYIADTRTLILNFTLPSANELPKLKGVTAIPESNSLNFSYLSGSEQQQLYAQIFFQLPLLILHELFRMDVGQALDSVIVNSWIPRKPPACVLSVKADKEHFLSLDLRAFDADVLIGQLQHQVSVPPHAANQITPIAQIDMSNWVVNALDKNASSTESGLLR